jgi:hypothetical protein
LEEGLAAYIEGQYVRSKVQHTFSPTSIKEKPQAYVPDHYRFLDDGLARFSSESVMGADGYALEMLMWAVDKKGIMDARTFVGDLLATRHKTSQAYALRNIISAINEIQPGLYEQLSRLPYTKEGCRDGCAMVYEAVTGDIWPAE